MTHTNTRQIDLSKLILFYDIHNYNYHSNQNRQLVEYQMRYVATLQARRGEALCICIYLLCQHLITSSTIVERTHSLALCSQLRYHTFVFQTFTYLGCEFFELLRKNKSGRASE